MLFTPHDKTLDTTHLMHDARTALVGHVVVLADNERLLSVGEELEHRLVFEAHQLGTLDGAQLYDSTQPPHDRNMIRRETCG